MARIASLTVFVCLLLLPAIARADCTIVYDVTAKKTLLRKGSCKVKHSPASTFKIPLALMGFDSKILTDEHNPSIAYDKNKYPNALQSWQRDTDPTYWEKASVVWYSQELTTKMGLEKLRQYVKQFDYGNKDISGKEALTHAWLNESLKISPDKQVIFLRKLLDRQLGVSDYAYDKTMAIIPKFELDHDWIAHGKTGSAVVTGQKRQFGWFIGWAEKAKHQIVFVRYAADKTIIQTPAGPRTRDEMLELLPQILPED